MLVIVVFFWVSIYNKAMQFYSDIYGHVVVLPLAVLKKSKLALKVI
jgi:hypothetical protein